MATIKDVAAKTGLIVPHIRHPYFAEVISNIEHQAALNRYKILLFNTQENAEKLREYIDACASSRVAGVILCSGKVPVEDLAALQVPMIMFERNPEQGTASVECDNYLGGSLAAEHLIEKGCRHLLSIGGVIDNRMPADIRETGFGDVCRKAGVPYRLGRTSQEQYNELEYYEWIEKMLLEYPEVDGIFAGSDVIAAQVLQVCNKLHRKVPEDMRVVGFDDVSLATLTTPNITTIHQPIDEMAELAVKLLTEARENKPVPKRTILPTALVVRGTT